MKKILLAFILFITCFGFHSVQASELSYEEQKQIIINEVESERQVFLNDRINTIELEREDFLNSIISQVNVDREYLITDLSADIERRRLEEIGYATDYFNTEEPGNTQGLEDAINQINLIYEEEYNNMIIDVNNFHDNRIIEETNNINQYYDNMIAQETININQYYDNYLVERLAQFEEEYNSNQTPAIPFELKQKFKQPYSEEKEILSKTKLGKFQSGSGVIISAFKEESDVPTRLYFEVTSNTYTGGIKNFGTQYSTGSTQGIATVGFKGTGIYNWKVRVENKNGNYSDWIEFDEFNNDFEYFDGFEPYPFGFKFENWTISPNELTGGLKDELVQEDIYRKVIDDGNKWDIFYQTFDESVKDWSDGEKIRAYQETRLDKQGGSCYGMSVAAAYHYSNLSYLGDKYGKFAEKNGSGYLWYRQDDVEEKEYYLNGNKEYYWSEYNDTTQALTSLRLSQFSTHHEEIIAKSKISTGALIQKLSNEINMENMLVFEGFTESGELNGHIVNPYRIEYGIESIKIYYWDSNYPFIEGDEKKGYEKYMEIFSDGLWEFKDYKEDFNTFDNLYLININDLYTNGNNLIPKGFNDIDTYISVSGNVDIVITNSQGQRSGYTNGALISEIPDVSMRGTLDIGSKENATKNIYIPNKFDYTLELISKNNESYDLMIAGGDYYTKLENVETSTGQIDTLISTRNNLEIDFDDNKVGEYNLSIDNFQDTNTGSIYINNIDVKSEKQLYTVDWEKVVNNTNDAIIYQIDTDNDGNYDQSTQLPPIFQDDIAPTTTHDFNGTPTSGETDSYIESVTIELSAQDNEGGSGLDATYYTLDNNSGSLMYLPYMEPIHINGVGEYTLSYYSTDIFGNIETVKTQTFTLTELPETYSGKISGYIYSDDNNNGVQDQGEKNMAGWKICMDLNNNNECEENIEPFNVTNNTGYYEFDSLETGDYKIIQIQRNNWQVTNPIHGYYDINLGNGEHIQSINFGNYKIKGNNKK